MPTTKLSPKQRDVLRLLAKMGAYAIWSDLFVGWIVKPADKFRSPTVKALLRQGLLDLGEVAGEKVATINAAGRAALGEPNS